MNMINTTAFEENDFNDFSIKFISRGTNLVQINE